jgi:hypothetical protein
MRLEKTGQIVRVDLNHLITMWEFANDFIHWEPEEYFRCADEKDTKRVIVSRNLQIEPDYVLFPVYKYFLSLDLRDTTTEKLGVEFKYDDRIRPENLSLFNVYRVIKDADPEVDIKVTAGIRTSIKPDNKPVIEIEDVGVAFKVGYDTNYPLVSLYWGNKYKEYLKTLKWARGRKWSNLQNKPMHRSKVVKDLSTIEVSMFAFVNLFYALHNGLKNDTVEYRLFEPYMKILQVNNTFEEALSNIKAVMMLLRLP